MWYLYAVETDGQFEVDVFDTYEEALAAGQELGRSYAIFDYDQYA